MAVEAGSSVDDDSPKIRFVRYLYIGKEYPVYHSGTWMPQNHFSIDKIPSVNELASDEETELFPIIKIKEAFTSDRLPKPETLIFALAACARQDQSEKLRHAAYEFMSECPNPEKFMRFISFASQLSRQSVPSKHGWGHGWRNAVNNWYLSKNALNLADCVTKYKSRYGWEHRDILKLSHPVVKGQSAEIQAVFRYILFGLDKTKAEFENQAATAEIVEFIERVEDFRQCTDPIRVAGLIRTGNYGLEHVHSKLLKAPEVWEALIEGMELPEVVANLQRIHNIGILLPKSQIMEKILNCVSDKERILSSKISPALLLMALKNYEDPEKVPLFAKRRAAKKNKLKQLQLPNPDKKLIAALYSALNTSFSNVKPCGMRFLITVSADGCRKKPVMPHQATEINKPWVLEAACVIALGLLRADDKITVSTFTATEGLNARPVHIDKNATFHDAMEKMRARSTGPANLGKPILWAAHHRRKFDVFINVVDKMREKYDFTARAMDLYKKKMNLPNARLVNWVVGTTSTYMEGKHVKDVLTICGFDVNVPRVIEAFAQRQF